VFLFGYEFILFEEKNLLKIKEAAEGNMKKILIVDDDPIFLMLLHRTLIDEGYRVTKIQKSQSAISAVENRTFDVVVTDLMMPNIDGIELMERILGIYPELPVIVITGSGNIEKAAEALKKGAFDFVSKPFELKKICTSIKRALEYG